MTVRLPRPDITVSTTPVRNGRYNPNGPNHVTADRPFIGWDGEGYTDDDGKHHLMLFGCSTGEYVTSPSLTAHDCFNLLLTVAAKRKANHVIYAGGYDMVMMVRNYPQHICERILHGHTTWYGGYRHEYFKSKFLKLQDGNGRSIILYDVFTFFSTSFVKACREYLGNNPDFDRIEATKLKRDSFTLDTLATDVIPYWQQELKYLVQLMDILRTRLQDADIHTSQWHGPGAVAGAVLKSRGIRAHMSTTASAAGTQDSIRTMVRDAARHAYYGGRFEQYQMGYHKGQVWQYDIRSAYPAAITRLPSLANLNWTGCTERRLSQVPFQFRQYGIYRVSYTAHGSHGIVEAQPLPWRDTDRSIYYPPDIHSSWYWGVELIAAQKYSDGTLVVHEGYEPSVTPVDYPFQWIQTMYSERAKMKREGNPTQLALKLGMNSIYGKLAQSKGARLREGEWQLPRYHQLEWAGWVTAATRALIYEAMHHAGSTLIAVETDAVYTTEPLPMLKCSEQLGDWEESVADAIMYIQSGVYFKLVDGSWKLKSRGFEPRNHTFDKWFEVMQLLPHKQPDVTHKSVMRRFGTDPRSEHFATWYEMVREANILAEQGKRVHRQSHCVWCSRGESLACGIMHPLVIPIDRINSASHSSTPHRLPWIDEGMKEWEDEFTVTEDGMYSLDFGEIDL